jgi:hypothetical protein
MSLFRRDVDSQTWLDEFNTIYREAAPLVGFVASFFSDKTPSESDLTILSGSRHVFGSLLQSLNKMTKPRDNRLYKMRKDFKGLLYACMRFCEWRVKQSEEPSRARLANTTFFMVAAVEHWKSLRLVLGDTTDYGRQ